MALALNSLLLEKKCTYNARVTLIPSSNKCHRFFFNPSRNLDLESMNMTSLIHSAIEHDFSVRLTFELNLSVRLTFEMNLSVRLAIEMNLSVRSTFELNCSVRLTFELNLSVRLAIELNLSVRLTSE